MSTDGEGLVEVAKLCAADYIEKHRNRDFMHYNKTMKIESLHEAIAIQNSKHPDKVAIVSNGSEITYRELHYRINTAIVLLAKHGATSGDRIGIDSYNSADLIIGSIASMAIGCIPVLMPGRDANTCNYIICDCSPSILIVGSEERLSFFGKSGIPTIKLSLESNVDSITDVSSLLRGEIDPEDAAMILYSSGTTSGTKKGIVQRYLALQGTVEYITDIMGIDESVVELVASPIDTAFGFGRCRVIFRAGGTIVFDSGVLNPAKVLVSMKQHGCNSIAGDSAIYIMLLNKFFKKHLVSLAPGIKWVKIASQVLPIEYKEMLLDIMTEARLFMNYGLTEAMRCTINEIGFVDGKIESVGCPCPGVSIEIVDKAGECLEANEVGEIRVAGVNIAKGYWGEDKLWSEVYRDGWFHTGDLGYIDRDGFLYIVGRKDDMMNIGGRMVSPDEIEEFLNPHLNHVQFAVCSIEDPTTPLGEVITLCVENEALINFETLRDNLYGSVEEFKIPNRLVHIEKIPRTENGKVQRRHLKKVVAGIIPPASPS